MPPADATLSLVAVAELAIKSSDDNAATSKVSLRAADIDALIARLAQLRATMTPEVPRVLTETMEVSKVADPMWVLHAPVGAKEKRLAVRHPGLGWVMFELPTSEAARLGQALLADEALHPAVARPSDMRLH